LLAIQVDKYYCLLAKPAWRYMRWNWRNRMTEHPTCPPSLGLPLTHCLSYQHNLLLAQLGNSYFLVKCWGLLLRTNHMAEGHIRLLLLFLTTELLMVFVAYWLADFLGEPLQEKLHLL